MSSVSAIPKESLTPSRLKSLAEHRASHPLTRSATDAWLEYHRAERIFSAVWERSRQRLLLRQVKNAARSAEDDAEHNSHDASRTDGNAEEEVRHIDVLDHSG